LTTSRGLCLTNHSKGANSTPIIIGTDKSDQASRYLSKNIKSSSDLSDELFYCPYINRQFKKSESGNIIFASFDK
jgi:hypothetical protein